MRRRAPLLVGILFLSFVAQQTAAGAAGNPQKRITAKDTLVATGVVLRTADVGPGWKTAPNTNSGNLSCGIVHQLQPDESTLVETGSAKSPLYTKSGAQALDQTVQVFATVEQARAAWSRTVTKTLVICMEQELENTSGMSAPVSVTGWKKLNLPHLLKHATGFRVIATAKTAAKTTTKVYLDEIVLSYGRALTKVVFSSLQKPFASSYEAQLAKRLSTRLTSAASAPA